MAAAVVALAVAAARYGASDDSPGLVLMAVLAAAGAVAYAVWPAVRRSRHED